MAVAESAHASESKEKLLINARCAGVFKAIAEALHTMPYENVSAADLAVLAEKYEKASASLTAKAAAASDTQTAFAKMNDYAQAYQDQINKDHDLRAVMPVAQSCNKLSRL